MLTWRRLALPLLLTLFGLLWAAAHALVHDAVSQPAAPHGGHDGAAQTYAAYLPTSLALCLVLATALATGVALGRRWTPVSGSALWLFGLVPVLGLTADSLIGLPAGDALSGVAVAELVPLVAIGLLVQIPFAVTAVGLGSTILLLAERLAWALRDAAGPVRPAASAGALLGAAERAPTLALAGVDRSRAPPETLSS